MSNGSFVERVNEFLIRRIVNTKARAARLLKPGSLVVLVLVTVTGAAAVLKELDIPTHSFWRTRGPATVALGIVAALSYLGYLPVVVGYNRTLRSSDQDDQLYGTCLDVAALVERETRLPPVRSCALGFAAIGWLTPFGTRREPPNARSALG